MERKLQQLDRGPEQLPANYGKVGLLQILSCGLGPSFAALFSNPLEVIKVRQQMQVQLALKDATVKPFSGLGETARHVLKNDGLMAFQAGLPMSVGREFFKCMLRIGLYQPLLLTIHTTEGKPPVWKAILAGGSCGAFASLCCNPLDLAKTRLQQQPGSVFRAIRSLIGEGGPGALWKGTPVSMMRSIAATGSSVPIKYTLQDYIKSQGFKGDTVPKLMLQSAISAFPASFTAVMCMQPMDVVRTRLYNQPVDASGRGLQYKDSIDCARQILNKEGVSRFWTGATAHFLRFGPHCVLAFVFIDLIQRFARDWKSQRLSTEYQNLVKTAFQEIDTDKNGKVDKPELLEAVRKLLPYANSAYLSSTASVLFEKVDDDKSGFIDQEEFIHLATELNTIIQNNHIDNLFDRMDTDKTGELSKDEMVDALTSASINAAHHAEYQAVVVGEITVYQQSKDAGVDEKELRERILAAVEEKMAQTDQTGFDKEQFRTMVRASIEQEEVYRDRLSVSILDAAGLN